MRQITEQRSPSSAQALAFSRAWWRDVGVTLGSFFAPLLLAMLAVGCLAALAYASQGVFEVCAALVFYSAFAYTTWVPLRDTAALAVIASPGPRARKRKMLMQGLILQIPLIMCMLGAGAYATGASGDAEGRSWFGLVLDVSSVFVVDLGVPLLVILFRRSVAADVWRGRGMASDASRMVHKSEVVDRLMQTSGQAAPSAGPRAKMVGNSNRVAPAPEGGPVQHMQPSMQRAYAAYAPGAAVGEATAGGVAAAARGGGLHSKGGKDSTRASAKVSPADRGTDDRARKAATKIQARFRLLSARRKYLAELGVRRKLLLAFSWPIFLASLLSRLGRAFFMLAADSIDDSVLWETFFFLPAFVICFVDLRREDRPRFSIAHCIFFTIVLYRLSFKAAEIDSLVWSKATDWLEALDCGGCSKPEWAVSTFTSGHFRIRTRAPCCSLLTSVSSNLYSGSDLPLYALHHSHRTREALAHPRLHQECLRALALPLSVFCERQHPIPYTSATGIRLSGVRSPDPCPSLFVPVWMNVAALLAQQPLRGSSRPLHSSRPSQDFIFLYTFFTIRTTRAGITTTWVAQQVLLQGNIILRNSGASDALARRYLAGLLRCGRMRLKLADPNDDPLFRLQYLARCAVQYDMADLTALLLTPAIITVFCWRDGWFTLQDSGILIRACDLPNLWARFIVLLCIKPAASAIARRILIRTMRKTLLGKETMHGRSALAARIITASQMVKTTSKSRVGKGGGGGGAGRQGEGGIGSDAELQSKFDLVEEELAAVREELSLTGLNFRVLRKRQLKKWRFYSAVCIVMSFAAFSVRQTAPIAEQRAAVAAGGGGGDVGSPVEAQLFDSQSFDVPLHSVWMYVPPQIALLMDESLRDAFEVANNDSTVICNA